LFSDRVVRDVPRVRDHVHGVLWGRNEEGDGDDGGKTAAASFPILTPVCAGRWQLRVELLMKGNFLWGAGWMIPGQR